MSDRSQWIKSACAGALLLAACNGSERREYHFDATGFDGVTSQTFAVLTVGDCVVEVNGDLTLTVGDDEVLYVFKRPTDGKIVANAITDDGGGNPGDECATTATATRKIAITGSTGTNKVLIDFLNGTFAPGIKGLTAMAHVPGITIDLDADAEDQVTIRGTTGVDNWALGTNGTAYDAVDVNADKVPDITMVAVESVQMTTGAGNDVFNGMGILTSLASSPLGIPMIAFGGADNDTFTSGAPALAATNVLNGGAGDDLFLQQNNLAVDQLVGGAGRDTADYKIRGASAHLNITVGAGADNDGESGEGDEVMEDVEIVLGGAGNDTLSADGLTDGTATGVAAPGIPVGTYARLVGNAGNDTLIGSAQNDVLEGGAGGDTLRGGAGSDTMTGGTDIDTVDYTTHGAGVEVSLAPVAMAQNGGAGEVDVFNAGALATHDIENLRGSPFGDTLTGNGNNNIIWGGDGIDTIDGGAGHDSIYGEAGNDNLTGGAGNDVIVGGLGDDTMSGGDGDDLLDALDGGTTDVVRCGAGNDVAVQDDAADLHADALDSTNAEFCELVQ